MANAQISPAKRLEGLVRVPGDKSIAHRALFCGALANGWTRIAGVPQSADIAATIRALNICGVQTQRNEDAVIVQGGGREAWRSDRATIDCANSGTTMRLLMGVLAGQPGTARLAGDASLSRRPMRRIAEPLERMGARVTLSREGVAPLLVDGCAALRGIHYELPVASAQLKTALLFAGMAAQGRTRLGGALRSRDHTERMLPQFGARLDVSADKIAIDGGQHLHGAFIPIPGDPSSAAYWIAAALVTRSSEIELRDICMNPTRAGFIDVLKRMGARMEIAMRRGGPEPVGHVYAISSVLRGTIIEGHEISSLVDELPLLAVLATQADGVTVVRGAQELRVKESDRIEAIAAALRAMGASIDTFDDGFSICGPQALRGASIDPCGDHRIAMSASIAALTARGETTIRDAECVGVSYPAFFSTLRMLGGNVQ